MRLVLDYYRLKGIQDDWRWQVGDWFSRGEDRFGDAVYAFTKPFRGVEGLRQYRWVSAQVLHGNRHPELSWSHHRAVAALPQQEQQEWLSKAAADSLTAPELSAMLRPFQGETHACPECGQVHRVKEAT